ncbi:cobyrinate a,c-diamide synthase [Prochlorococcus sp. MIT 1341]|uniref:cobyrinate a,c-diamide synthase n=1 Tax=Prochlorococcus sp. MIT 1341 TaxID=3096221 RepID=UPI002A75A369|nr:cobyrinate a,c-diamide synthase [Prochlorococcus sp. MIT 1341]
MAFVVAAPSSGSGKTILSLVLLAWAKSQGFRSQPFKIGPDYLDAEHLTKVSGSRCRNLDIPLCGFDWVKKSFQGYGGQADFVLVEGVMGLFDGVGASDYGSTASVAKYLDLPVVLVVDASGQAASIAALLNGFCLHDEKLRIAGVVLNKINSKRHLELLTQVLTRSGVRVLGHLPRDSQLTISSKNLGLVPAHELDGFEKRYEGLAFLAERHLDLETFKKLLLSPQACFDPVKSLFENENENFFSQKYSVAIAQDRAFHFRYEEMKECLSCLGVELIPWSPLNDEALPPSVSGLMIPGGFPEEFAELLSTCRRSLNEIRSFYGKFPIYAECGGMMLLGESIYDTEGNNFKLSGILPYSFTKSSLKVGYRKMIGINDTLLIKKNELLVGHEFHRWHLVSSPNPLNDSSDQYLDAKSSSLFKPWKMSGYLQLEEEEGFSNCLLHASWVHLHWASNIKLAKRWRKSLELVITQ